MKLEPKAKPVRIRIKSGGEEHFSLDSLKRNFSVQDLWEAVRGKSLSRWLRRQNENELADNVDKYCEIEKPTIEEYVGFSSLFFKDNALTDVNSLIDYYQSKELQKNLQHVLVYVFDSLDYEKGKAWFRALRRMKRDEEWADFFEHRLDALNDLDVLDCHKLLADLYDGMGNTTKKVFHLKKASAQLNIMAKSNGEFLLYMLEIGDYQCVKSLFDDSVIQGKVETKKWIEAFRRSNDSLNVRDQGECLYILSTLYDKVQDYIMSKMCLKMAEDVGFQIEKKKPQDYSGRTGNSSGTSRVSSGTSSSSNSSGFPYPKLSKLILSYKNSLNRKVGVGDLTTISSRLWDLVPSNKYFKVCYECLVMYSAINNTSRQVLIAKRTKIIDIMSDTKPLAYIVAALAWEEKTKSKDLYGISKSAIPANYWKVFEIKQYGKEVVITSECGLRCNTVRDSNIEQMFFFMQTFGEQYSYEYMN